MFDFYFVFFKSTQLLWSLAPIEPLLELFCGGLHHKKRLAKAGMYFTDTKERFCFKYFLHLLKI